MLGPPKARALDRSVVASLETLVPADHFYRHLDATLDLSFVRDWVKDCYASGGRPSIDPVVFFRLQLVMFFEGIHWERQLMRLATDRLSIRWYLGFHLDEPLPDHSSLTRIRDRYGIEIFRRFFDEIVEQCERAGLVWGKELYFDATKVQANASIDSMAPRFAVEAHLEALFAPQDMAPNDDDAEDADEEVPAPASLPTPEDRYEELAEANFNRHDWIAKEGQQNRAVKGKDYVRIADFQASRTDPDASLMRSLGAGSRLGYHVHYGVDGGRARIIRTVLVTPYEVMENQVMLDLLWHTCFR
jgi:transposase